VRLPPSLYYDIQVPRLSKPSGPAVLRERHIRQYVRNGFNNIKVVFDIDADAKPDDIKALVAQSQKRSAVYDILTNPTNITVDIA
jgi:uncharacterized OsmC-like protein